MTFWTKKTKILPYKRELTLMYMIDLNQKLLGKNWNSTYQRLKSSQDRCTNCMSSKKKLRIKELQEIRNCSSHINRRIRMMNSFSMHRVTRMTYSSILMYRLSRVDHPLKLKKRKSKLDFVKILTWCLWSY